jgi:antitoxin HicB
LTPEEDGGFSAECTNLPGVISEGDTEEEAIANVAEAFRETIRYYVSEGLRVPFGPVGVDNCHGCLEKTMDVSI